MKKLLRWGLVGMVVVVAVLASLVSIAVKIDRDAMAKITPPTLSELDALSERLREATPQADLPENPAGEAAAPEPAALPTRLASAPTLKALEGRYVGRNSDPKLMFVLRLIHGPVVATLRAVGGERAGLWTWEYGVGEVHELMGEWDAAKRCWREALDLPLSPQKHRYACGQLAWLEHDPEIAARLLEISCQESERAFGPLVNAVELCRVTGSTELADHYLGRLRAKDPKRAEYYDLTATQDAPAGHADSD